MNLDDKFWRFHRDNPHIYDLILKHVREVKAAGFKHYGIGSIYERIRWHINVETKDTQFKLSNSYRSRYARLVERNEPHLKGFFRSKPLHTYSSLEHEPPPKKKKLIARRGKQRDLPL